MNSWDGWSFLATLIIGGLQIWQSKRMSDFEQRQDMRDEDRHFQQVKSDAIKFISKYSRDRGLIPLCAIATMYNPVLYYHREMYREYCCFTIETQNKILEYCKFDFRVSPIDFKCVWREEFSSLVKSKYPDDVIHVDEIVNTAESAINLLGDKKVKDAEKFDMSILKILRDENNVDPLQTIINDFRGYDNLTWILINCLLVDNLSIENPKVDKRNGNFGHPGSYEEEQLISLEDYFLKAMFELYVNRMV